MASQKKIFKNSYRREGQMLLPFLLCKKYNKEGDFSFKICLTSHVFLAIITSVPHRKVYFSIGISSESGIKFWDLSSAGRASALQAEGHRFEPYRSHLWRDSSVGQSTRFIPVVSRVQIPLSLLSKNAWKHCVSKHFFIKNMIASVYRWQHGR